jgi:hypothetical protein
MERALGADLDALRVHTDFAADQVATRLGADAVTCGADIFFASGRYDAGSRAGLRLLAHEAAHAVQQAGLRLPRSAAEVYVDSPASGAERSAHAAADRAAAGAPAGRSGASVRVRPLGEADCAFIQRHGSWEHRLLGDAATGDLDSIAQRTQRRERILEDLASFLEMWKDKPKDVDERAIKARYPDIRTVRLKKSGLLVTYGELNTLPDYMANPAVLDDQPEEILLPILQSVRQEGYYRVRGLLNRQGSPFAGAVSGVWYWDTLNLILETRALDNLTWNIGPKNSNHYLAVLGRNACHFAPFSWYRWQQHYLIAADLAVKAFSATDPGVREKLTYDAWMYHGYADHFLQDSFAAGHLVNKNLVMQWFTEWVADKWVPVTDWERVKHLTTARQPGVAARGLYNPADPGIVRDAQTAEEEPDNRKRMDMCGVRADGSIPQTDSYQNYLAFLDSSMVQLSSGALHDKLNVQGLWVASDAIPEPFLIYGDETMLNGGDGVRIASETAHLSQRSIIDRLARGSSDISVESLWRRFPTKVRQGSDLLSLETWMDAQRDSALGVFGEMPYLRMLIAGVTRMRHISQYQDDQPRGEWVSLGGGLPDERPWCTVGANHDGRLEVFHTGTDRGVWHRWQTTPSGAWSDWHSLAGDFLTKPVPARNADGRQVVFVRGPQGDVRFNWQMIVNANQWTGWQNLGGKLLSNPAPVLDNSGCLDVFYLGTDAALWHRRQKWPNDNNWHGEESLRGDELQGFVGDPAVSADFHGRLHVFCYGKVTRSVWHRQQTPNGEWLGWASFGAGDWYQYDPVRLSAGRNRDGRLDAFAVGTDGALWHKYQTAAGGDWRQWTAWQSLGGKFTGSPALAYSNTGRLDLFAQGQDGFLWHAQSNSARQWSKWDAFGGFQVAGEPATGQNTNGRMQVFIRGADKAQWYRLQIQADGRWQ